MAARNLCFCIIMALVAGNLILAEEEKAGFPFSFGDVTSLFGFRESKPSEETQGREAAAAQSSNQDHDDRFFFFSRIVNCNYTAQAGSTCVSCSQALRCFNNNIGILRSCRGIFHHCNSGRCSLFAPAACNSTSG